MKRRFILLCAAASLFACFAVNAVEEKTVPQTVGASRQEVVANGSGETVKPVAQTNVPEVKEKQMQVLKAAKKEAITPASIMQKGGGLMYVLAALSLAAISLIIFYLLTLRASLLYPRAFIIEAQDAASAGDLQALKEVCNESDCLAARILSSSLGQCDDGPVDYESLRDGIEDEGARQAGLLWQRLQYLMDIAVIAPMVGLLGTIWGMMLSFQNFETSDITAKVHQLTSGVSTAMYTTFGGLIVGIFSMAMYDVLRGHLTGLIGGMESACGSVLRRLSPKLR